MSDGPILICDFYNVFLRAYSVMPDMGLNGAQIGGIVGTLKTLRKLVSDHRPKAVYIIYESGGSARRRAIFKEYKEARKPAKLNRFYEDDIPDTPENKIYQIQSLARLLKNLPVCQVYVKDCEADDVIAYLTRKFSDDKIIIASSDKDFYQLLNERVSIYSLHKKRIITPLNVYEEFHISPKNFALAKAICGDPSDNIPGVEGVGFKTLAKRIPLFGSDIEVTLEALESFCTVQKGKVSMFGKVLEMGPEIRRNLKLIDLSHSILADHQEQKVDYLISTFRPSGNKIGLIRGLIAEGILNFEVDNFFYSFYCITLAPTEEE